MSELVGFVAALRVSDLAADVKRHAEIQGVHNQSLDGRFQRLEACLFDLDARLRVVEAALNIPSPPALPLPPGPPDPVAALESMTSAPNPGEGAADEA